MTTKKYISLFLSVLITYILQAAPGTYYNSIDTNKSCANFKTILAQLISTNTTVLPYGIVDDNFNKTDLKPATGANTGWVVSDKYSSDNPGGIDFCNYRFPSDFCLGRPASTECYCYNKEHSFPKAWFGGAYIYPMYSDMHFIWPSDAFVNTKKLDYSIGYVYTASYTSKNGNKIGSSNTSANYGYNYTKVFEPIDSFKGDFARAYLYVITRYEDSLLSWVGRSSIASSVLDGNKYPGFKPWMLQLCAKWNKLDPPSAFERKRNDSVYGIQGNRNPYIDYPNWVEKVFGIDGIASSCVNTSIKENRSLVYSVFPNPVQDALLNIRMSTNITEEVFVEISDILGRTILTQSLHPANLQNIDVSTLERGMYFININYKGQNNASLFIKE